MIGYCDVCYQQILVGESIATQHGKPIHLRCSRNRPTFQAPWSFGSHEAESTSVSLPSPNSTGKTD